MKCAILLFAATTTDKGGKSVDAMSPPTSRAAGSRHAAAAAVVCELTRRRNVCTLSVAPNAPCPRVITPSQTSAIAARARAAAAVHKRAARWERRSPPPPVRQQLRHKRQSAATPRATNREAPPKPGGGNGGGLQGEARCALFRHARTPLTPTVARTPNRHGSAKCVASANQVTVTRGGARARRQQMRAQRAARLHAAPQQERERIEKRREGRAESKWRRRQPRRNSHQTKSH